MTFLLKFIPSLLPAIIKMVAGAKAAPEVSDVINDTLNPVKNPKAVFVAALALLAMYGHKIPPEWIEFAKALWPYLAAYAAAFLIGKTPAK